MDEDGEALAILQVVTPRSPLAARRSPIQAPVASAHRGIPFFQRAPLPFPFPNPTTISKNPSVTADAMRNAHRHLDTGESLMARRNVPSFVIGGGAGRPRRNRTPSPARLQRLNERRLATGRRLLGPGSSAE